MNRRVLACALLALPLAAAGCGSSTSQPPPVTTRPTTTAAQMMALTVYRLSNGVLSAETVEVPATQAVAGAALKALGLDATVTISNGTATVDLPGATDDQIEEVVFTLTQFPTVQRVAIGGKTYTRSDFDGRLQPILVDTPAAHVRVAKTFHVTGSASVFEATLVVELEQGGKPVAHVTATASQGAPGRGSFDTTLTAPGTGPATVVAYAPSAEDGSPQHEVRVPVVVTP
jgi:immunoglobulin-like protein involved in spore germination/sporulation and spore germination protein